MRFKTVKELPSSAQQIATPYDKEARYSIKRGMEWVGYKVHLTETCDEAKPRMIVHVETTVATTPDDNLLPTIHQNLAGKALLPSMHIVDAGYTSANVLVNSAKDYGVEVVGPLAVDSNWQAKAGAGFDKSHFRIDWKAKKVICPNGKQNTQWKDDHSSTHPIKVRWSNRDCATCSLRPQCTKSQGQGRQIALQTREQHEVTQNIRQQQTTPAFKTRYKQRAWVEGTMSQAVRHADARHARYIGLSKTHFQQLGIATGLNLIRFGEWLAETPLAKARTSAFARLKLAS